LIQMMQDIDVDSIRLLMKSMPSKRRRPPGTGRRRNKRKDSEEVVRSGARSRVGVSAGRLKKANALDARGGEVRDGAVHRKLNLHAIITAANVALNRDDYKRFKKACNDSFNDSKDV